MGVCRIAIAPLSQNKATFPECHPCVEAVLYGVSILEGGVATGQTSLAIHAKTHDGKYVTVQILPNTFEAIAAAFTGARERFEGIKPTQPTNN